MTQAIVHTLYPRGCDIHGNQLTVDLPEHLIKALEAHATARNATIKDTVADLIHDATGANCRRYGDRIADRYLRSLVEETEDIVREIQAQDDDLQHRPMWEYGLAMRFHRGAIELLDGDNKLRDREYEIGVGEHVSISDIAASFRNEPWAVNLLAVIEMYEGLRHPGTMLPALHWATQQLQDSLKRSALSRLAGEPKVPRRHESTLTLMKSFSSILGEIPHGSNTTAQNEPASLAGPLVRAVFIYPRRLSW